MPLPGNARLWLLLQASARQWRFHAVGSHGVTISQAHGLDMTALSAMAPGYGLTLNQALFDKLRLFERECLDIWEGKASCDERKKAYCAARFGAFFEETCKTCKDRKTGG